MLYGNLDDAQKKNISRTLIWGVWLVFAAIFFFALYYGALAVREWKNIGDEHKFQISAAGEGAVFLKPDIATISLTVRTQAVSLADATKENNDKNNKVVEFLKAKGVEEKDIKTVGYNVNPQYQYDNRPCPATYSPDGAAFPCPPQKPPRIASYEVTNSLLVKVRNLDNVGAILDGATAAGANEVSGPSFSIDDETKVTEEARALAIDNAKENAKKVAAKLGVRLGRIVGFSESGNGPYPVYMEAFGKGGALTADAPVPRAPSIQPGENEVKVSVSVFYEVRQ